MYIQLYNKNKSSSVYGFPLTFFCCFNFCFPRFSRRFHLKLLEIVGVREGGGAGDSCPLYLDFGSRYVLESTFCQQQLRSKRVNLKLCSTKLIFFFIARLKPLFESSAHEKWSSLVICHVDNKKVHISVFKFLLTPPWMNSADAQGRNCEKL